MNGLPWWGIAVITILVFLNGLLFRGWIKKVGWGSFYSGVVNLIVAAIAGGVLIITHAQFGWVGLTVLAFIMIFPYLFWYWHIGWRQH